MSLVLLHYPSLYNPTIPALLLCPSQYICRSLVLLPCPTQHGPIVTCQCFLMKKPVRAAGASEEPIIRETECVVLVCGLWESTGLYCGKCVSLVYWGIYWVGVYCKYSFTGDLDFTYEEYWFDVWVAMECREWHVVLCVLLNLWGNVLVCGVCCYLKGTVSLRECCVDILTYYHVLFEEIFVCRCWSVLYSCLRCGGVLSVFKECSVLVTENVWCWIVLCRRVKTLPR